MKPSEVRTLIADILKRSGTLMNAEQINQILTFRHGLSLSNLQVGINLGYLRAGGICDRREAPRWAKPYWRSGSWHFSTESWWWHTDVVTKATAIAFTRKIRVEVESMARDNQRLKGRPVSRKLPPRTDDMRQMIIDIGRMM